MRGRERERERERGDIYVKTNIEDWKREEKTKRECVRERERKRGKMRKV